MPKEHKPIGVAGWTGSGVGSTTAEDTEFLDGAYIGFLVGFILGLTIGTAFVGWAIWQTALATGKMLGGA